MITMTQKIPEYRALEIAEIKSQLCVYDPRNPFSARLDIVLDDDESRSTPCYCDACFYGTAALANQLLTLLEQE